METSAVSLRGFYLSSYVMNGSQLASMAVMALAVPYLIGFTEYGLYAVAFAVPGMMHGFVERALVTMANQGRKESRAHLDHFAGLIPAHVGILILGTLVICCIMVLLRAADLVPVSLGLFLALYAKALAFSRICEFADDAGQRNAMMVYEFALIAAILAFAFFVRDHMLPVAAMILASLAMVVVSGIRYPPHLSHMIREAKERPMDAGRFFAEMFHVGSSRLYEDGQLTLLPALLFPAFGATVAGQYRLMVSLIKFVTKLFPLRSEMMQLALAEGRINWGKLAPLLAVFLFAGLPLYLGIVLVWEPLGLPDFGWVVWLSLVAGCAVVVITGIDVLTMQGWAWLATLVGAMVLAIDFVGIVTDRFATAFIVANIVAAIIVTGTANLAMRREK